MSLNPTVFLLLLVLLAVGLASLLLGLRNRLALRIAMRNVRRGRWRTVLVILGLLIGTSIISASLVVGDTVSQLDLHLTYQVIGYTDEGIYNQSPDGSYTFFPYSVYTSVAGGTAGFSDIRGVTPEIITSTAVLDRTTGVPQAGLNLIGVNGNQSGALGAFTTDAGTQLAGPAPGQVLLDDGAASQLNASAGHTVSLYGPHPVTAVVQAIVQDDTRGGFLGGGLGTTGNVFIDLATAQSLSNESGKVNFLAVTNAGSQVAGVGLSDGVSAHLNATVAQVPAARGLGVHELLKDSLSAAATSGSFLTTLFFVFGLFSIIAGGMLIVGIFVMLAEERKGEMGMLRAVGFRRRQLILVYYFEGLAYAAGSAFVGTLVGLGIGFGLIVATASIFAGAGLSASAILSSFTVLPESLLITYVAGFLLTLVTVIAASTRASRLNIVRAIRNIPEPPPPLRLYTRLAYLGVAAVVLGLLLFFPTYRGTGDISVPVVGGALVILGVGLLASRFAPNRWVFTATGLGFLLWAGVPQLQEALLGTGHSGSFTVVFTFGILMVLGAILLYIFNAQLLVRGLSRVLSTRRAFAPIVRVGLAYPSRRSGRTAINLTIFALVVFTLVAIASFGATTQANLSNTLQAQSGGFTFFGFSEQPIPNLPQAVQANATLARQFSLVLPLVTGGVELTVGGATSAPYPTSVYSPPANATGPTFYTANGFPFSSTLGGASASSVWSQLASDRSVAVVDGSFSPSSGGGGSFGPPHPAALPGSTLGLLNPATGARSTVKVIGMLSESIIGGVWVNPAVATQLGFVNQSAFFLTVPAGQSTTHAAQSIKSAFLPYGLLVLDLAALLSQSIYFEESFIGLLQIFVALGLAIGIAAIGIVALRAVVERRAQIGMLRAAGFTRRMILWAILLEYSFVTLLGIAIGMGLGILLIVGLVFSSGASAQGIKVIAIPWVTLGLVALLAYGLTILAIAAPSLRAARLPPAEAVRILE